MSGLWLYAVLGGPVSPGRVAAADGVPLILVEAAGLWIAAGQPDPWPRLCAAALRHHQGVVEELAAAVPAVLPVRFDQSLEDQEAIGRWVMARQGELQAALAQVAGCVQMTLRVWREEQEGAAADPAVPVRPAGGPGERYLAARRQARMLPEIEELRAGLRPLLRAERIERASGGPLAASVYDLVPREHAAAYRTRVETAAGSGPRVTLSGPWAPWAFAAGTVR